MIVDATFYILEENVPSLLLRNKVLESVLYIRLQGHYLHMVNRRAPIHLENHFFVSR